MPACPYVQLDVFGDRPGAGNPLAVIPDARGLNDADMQAIARWTRLPETTFVFPAPSASADYAVRIFSPRREVPFAGHPSVGTAHVLLDRGQVTPRDGLLVQSGAVGELPLRVEGEGRRRTVAVRTPRASVVEVAEAGDPRLRDALAGLATGALPPVLMDGGRRWWLAELRDEAELRSAVPDWAAIAALAEAGDAMVWGSSQSSSGLDSTATVTSCSSSTPDNCRRWMAWRNWGVSRSCWPSATWRVGFIACFALQPESFAEVDAAHVRV